MSSSPATRAAARSSSTNAPAAAAQPQASNAAAQPAAPAAGVPLTGPAIGAPPASGKKRVVRKLTPIVVYRTFRAVDNLARLNKPISEGGLGGNFNAEQLEQIKAFMPAAALMPLDVPADKQPKNEVDARDYLKSLGEEDKLAEGEYTISRRLASFTVKLEAPVKKTVKFV